MDPLSDLLSLLKPQSYATGGVALRQNMAIQWPEHAGIKCYAVVSGQCWLAVTGVPEAVRLTAGDCYLLPPGPSFVLATHPQAEPVDFRILRDAGQLEKVDDKQPGCFLVGGHFVLSGHHADLLLSALQPVVHIRKESDKAAMHWSLQRMAEEARNPQPGSALITQQLAYMLLIQALRLYLTEQAGVGWLFALSDKQMNAALTCIHQDPGYAWTLQTLARQIGMSRSAFALRFRQTTGSTPIKYLTRWRMLLACERLKNSAGSIADIAASLGYESESAFGKAFKRVMGHSPGQYSRRFSTTIRADTPAVINASFPEYGQSP